MAKIKTEQLQEGMVVAGDVMNIDNMLLIPHGCKLTERQIGILQAWGIAEVEIEGAVSAQAADPLAGLSPEVLAKMSAEVKNRFFQPNEASPVYAEVFKIMMIRRARKAPAK